jgi:Gpi18-like mannosyltransferase
LTENQAALVSPAEAPLTPAAISHTTTWQRWIALVPILILALGLRVIFVPELAYRGDIEHFAIWTRLMGQYGMLDFYNPQHRFADYDRVYPALSTLSFGIISPLYGDIGDEAIAARDVRFLAMIKGLPILCELIMIAAAYWWLIDRRGLRIVIAGLLAIHPALIATSAWWGQQDAAFTLFLVLSVMALNRNKPILAWVMFAMSVLFKQPALVLGPLLFIVTFRRYGLIKLIQGGLISAALIIIPTIPFAMTSGVTESLSPFLRAGDVFPYVSNNAYNTWWAWATIKQGKNLGFPDEKFADKLPILPEVSTTLSYKTVGLSAFALFVLALMVVMWRQAAQPLEFVWATTLLLGFFMLPTQVHERYLYPAVVLALFAAAQDKRLWILAIGLGITYTYNALGIAIPYKTLDKNMFGTPILALPTALLNIALFVIGIVITAFVPNIKVSHGKTPQGLRSSTKAG